MEKLTKYYIYSALLYTILLAIGAFSLKMKVLFDYNVVFLMLIFYPLLISGYTKLKSIIHSNYSVFFLKSVFTILSIMYFSVMLMQSLHNYKLSSQLVPLLVLLVFVLLSFIVIKVLRKEIWFTEKFLNYAEKCINIHKEEGKKVSNNSLKVLFLGFIAFILVIYYLEAHIQHLYFLNDDNFHQFLPVIIQAMRGVFEQGLFPEINQYQMLGSPTSSLGVYALTYPVTYLSYIISKYIIHNEYWTIDVFVIIHLAVAYFMAFWAAKSLRIKPIWCFLFAFCYSLSGYNITTTRSWYYMASIVAFAPSIIIALEYIRNYSVDLKYILSFGLLLGILAHSGNIQMVAYIYVFYTLALLILYITKEFTLKKTLASFLPLILGCIIAMPLLLSTFDIIKNIRRYYWEGWNLNIDTFKYFFFPYGKGLKSLYFTGTVLFITGLFQMLMLSVNFINKTFDWKKYLNKNLYLVLGFIALILCFGEGGIIWKLLHSLPIFFQFKHPCKMVLFVNLFILILSCQFLSYKIKNKIIKILFFIMSLVLMLLLFNNKYATFFYYQYNNYVNPAFIMKNINDLNLYRIYSFAPTRCNSKNYPLTMANNFASIYKLYSIQMYESNLDNILPENKKWNRTLGRHIERWHTGEINDKKAEKMQEYGVKYFFFPDSKTFSFIKTKQIEKIDETNNEFVSSHYKEILNNDEYKIKIYELPNPRPLCFIKNTYDALPVEMNSQGAIIETNGLKSHTKIILNMAYRPRYSLYVNNKKYPIEKDDMDRIEIDLPEQSDKITVKYHSPWETSTGISVVFLIIFGVGMVYFRRYYNE